MRVDASEGAIRAALSHIPPDLPRDEWARVAMALKSEFGDAGAPIFDEWSSAGSTYDARAARDTWRSVKASGGVRIGSLLHLAKRHGYTPAPPPPGASTRSAAPARQAREAARQRATDEASAEAARHERGAAAAARVWASGRGDGASDYLARKGVGAHGVRFTCAGALLVPMQTADGTLVNVQTIRADGEKRYLRGARKSGAWHMLGGELDRAPWVLVAEGYATAATLHEATGRPVACAFDAANLAPVARALRNLSPHWRVAVAGDDDQATAARTGRNPGREAAERAARAVHGLAIFPQGLEAQHSDWNDLAATAGQAAVRAQVEAALEQPAGPARPSAPAAADADEAASERFRVDESAVWFDPPGDGDGAPPPIRVCGRLRALALARDEHDGAGALLVEFDSLFGAGRRWLMPLSMLASDGVQYRAELFARGFVAPVDRERRALLTRYLATRRPRARVRLTDRTGWHSRRFVLPRETIGDDPDDRLMFQADVPVESPFAQRGTVADWRQAVARPCEGNSRLGFAVCAAFAGPCLALAGAAEGGAVHFHGDSATGKTTLLRGAASVWGGPEYKGQWRATTNGLEAVAAAHSDATLVLDELGQLENREAGEAAYLLSNGVGKARAGRTGAARPRLTWRTLVLSAGEIDLAQAMDEAGRRMRAGQDLRLAAVPADAGAHLGVFERLHEFHDPGALAQHLARATETTYGAAGRAWLEHLAEHYDEAAAELRELVDAIAAAIVPEAASGQVQRVGRRFALIGAAGELATRAGLTGWPEGEATRAARRCFEAWLAVRPGGVGMTEDALMLRQVRAWLIAHGDARLVDWDRADDDHAPRTMHRAGWRKRRTLTLKDERGDNVTASADEFYIAADVFRVELAKGYSDRAVLRLLKRLGHLHTEARGFTCSASPPGAHRVQVVRIAGSILQGRDDD